MANGKKLSDDDRILWGKVARTARPMPGRKQEFDAFEEEIDNLETLKAAAKAKAEASVISALEQPAPPKKPAPRQHHALELPVKRKLSRGHLKLEARIDLHGMFQSEAHTLLHSFLIRAHQRGLRHVLVITGKGSSMGSDGALKRAVPMWFSKPDFSHLISSFETAAQNHGGDGALYVRLAREHGERS
jgi:DNA-nicking Smr family endonuclease